MTWARLDFYSRPNLLTISSTRSDTLLAAAADSVWISCLACLLKDYSRVPQFFLVGRDVQDERPKTDRDVARDFLCNAVVASHQIGTEGLVVFKRHEPVGVVICLRFLCHFRQQMVPGGIRHLHGQLMGELALAVLRESLMSHVPCFVFLRSGDDSDADTGIESGVRQLLGTLVGGLWILDGSRPDCLSRRPPCLRRAGDEDSGKKFGRQRRRQPQVV